MEIAEALEVVRRLADGLHPDTTEPLNSDSVFQLPRTVRALHRAVLALEFQQRKERPRKLTPLNTGKAWSDEEDARLALELRKGIALDEIARTHNRRMGSVVARLMRVDRNTQPVTKGS